MADIAFPASSRPGASRQEGAGRLINAYAEALGEGGRNPTALRRVPGLTPFCETGLVGLRGLRKAGDVVVAVFTDTAVLIASDGRIVSTIDLAGSGRVTIARNNAAPSPHIVAVTEYGAFRLQASRAAEPLALPGNLPSPNSVCELFGFLFFTAGNGTCFSCGPNRLEFNTLDYTVEQSRPGGLLRGVAYRDELFLFGPSGIGVYGGEALPGGFPLRRRTGIPRGLVGPWAVAGYEEGWSNELYWAGDDCVVYRLDGYAPVRVSTHDVERDLAAAAKIDPASIECSVYLVAGHACLVVSMPGRTWVYDVVTSQWHERASNGSARWRATQSVQAFGRWLMGDRAGTSLLAVDEGAFDEAGEPLRMRVESLPGEAFPQRLAIPRADFDFVVGQGRAVGAVTVTDPKVLVSWSDDGGATWSSPLTRALGRQGDARARVNVLRTGMTGVQGRTWRLDVSDPVYCALLGGGMAVEGRTE